MFLFLCSGALTSSLQHPQSVKNGSRYMQGSKRSTAKSVAVGRKLRGLRRAMTWPQGMEPLRLMSLCVGWMVTLIGEIVLFGSIFASPIVGPKLDCWLAPNRTSTERSCDEVRFGEDRHYTLERFYYAKRNDLTLDYAPSSCQSIHNTDVVSNETEAQDCTAWCEEHLGRGAGAPIYFVVIVVAALERRDAAEPANIFKSCWKANLAAVADSYIPNPWLVGVLYRFFGLLPAAIVLWRGSHQARQNEDEAPPDVNPPDRLCCRDDGPFRHGNLGFPWCCWRASNDLCASRWKLFIAAFGIVTEPLFDAITVTTFLKNGQPFYFVAMLFGLYCSFFVSGRDGLQAQGALAFVPSWQRGFATKELLKQRRYDMWECFFSTCIQLYAALTLSWKESPFEILQFGAFGCMSLVLSLPEAVQPSPKNFDDFYEVEDAKKTPIHRVCKYIFSVLVVFSVQVIRNGFHMPKTGGLDGVCTVAWLAETVLVVYYLAYQPYRGYMSFTLLIYIWLFGLFTTASLPSHVRRFIASWESFQEIPWTWPLSLTWHTWLYLPWPWLEARWDLMAAAMQVGFAFVGILFADIMGYREFELLCIIFAPCFWTPQELYTPT